MRTSIAQAVLILVPGLAMSQGVPGTNVAVDVGVTTLSMRGDTAEVTYAVRNRTSSAEQLFHFTVDAPSPVVRILVPQPQDDWATNVRYRSRSVAEWVMLGDQMSPGQESPPLVFSAVGLPATVTYWVRGYVPPPPLTPGDTLPVVQPADPLVTSSIRGSTVGIVPFPSDLSLASLLSRLITLTDQMCSDVLWITSASVCGSLRAKLQQASQSVTQGDNGGARAQLESFLTQLGAQRGPGLPVNDNAYWLLKVNAEFILNRIPPSVSTLFLHGSGGTANPPTLALSTVTPTATTAKYQDSPAIKYSGGNPWVTVGTWTAPPGFGRGTLSALGAAQLWLGLKNSDDIGTNFDLRVEAYKNGILVAAGQTLCVQSVTRNPDVAKAVTVAFPAFAPTAFDGVTDALSLKVSTRIGTTAAGAACGGHANAVGLRLYFDAASRAAQFAATF
jgi:FIMAH domain-containing protein